MSRRRKKSARMRRQAKNRNGSNLTLVPAPVVRTKTPVAPSPREATPPTPVMINVIPPARNRPGFWWWLFLLTVLGWGAMGWIAWGQALGVL